MITAHASAETPAFVCPACKTAITPASVTILRAAELLGVHHRTVYVYLRHRMLRSCRVGFSQRVTLKSIHSFLAGRVEY